MVDFLIGLEKIQGILLTEKHVKFYGAAGESGLQPKSFFSAKEWMEMHRCFSFNQAMVNGSQIVFRSVGGCTLV